MLGHGKQSKAFQVLSTPPASCSVARRGVAGLSDLSAESEQSPATYLLWHCGKWINSGGCKCQPNRLVARMKVKEPPVPRFKVVMQPLQALVSISIQTSVSYRSKLRRLKRAETQEIL